MSEEGLQIAEKKREVKGKGGKERYTHLNAEFQRIARRDKKALLPSQLLALSALMVSVEHNEQKFDRR